MMVFILIPWFHPAYKAGGPIQSVASMVKLLENESLEFSIFCSNKDLDGSLVPPPHDRWVQYSVNTKVWYSSDDRIVPLLEDEIEKQHPSSLYIVGLYDLNYNFKPLLHFKNVKKIISVRGMLHPGALSQKSFKKKLYLAFWKLVGWHKKNLFHVTDVKEKEFVLKVFGTSTPVAIADNFPLLFTPAKMPLKEPGMLKLISIALISPMKNHLPVLEALKKVGSWHLAVSSEQEAGVNVNIEYNIYGPVKDKNYWEKCNDLIKTMPSHIVVKYHGAVSPSAIEGALELSHIFIMPSKSENFGHSIIEALSAGRPVITSNATPWNNLEVSKAGINVNAENENELVDAIRFFADMNQETLEEWSLSANHYAVNAVNVDTIKEQYRELFKL